MVDEGPVLQANSVLGQTNYIGMHAPTGGSPAKTPLTPGLHPKGAEYLFAEEWDFAVSTGGIRDAENQLIWDGSWQVNQFEAFKKKVLDEEDWVFLVTDPHDIKPYYHRFEPAVGKWENAVHGGQPEGVYADYKDPNPEQTQKTIDNQHALLRAVGDSIEAIGHFAAMLNNAAQLYALADENSCPPSNSTV
jgi:hypothetical protein